MMRLRELLESSDSTYIEIYEHLKSECQTFFELSHGFKYTPHRRMSVNDAKQELQYLFRIKNRPMRHSATDEGDDKIREFLDIIFKEKGFASRYEYMMASSSLGENSLYPVNKDSPYVFPIGNFSYSYIPDDFNKYTEILEKTDFLRIFYYIFDVDELKKLGISTVFHSKETFLKFYWEMCLQGKIPDIYDDEIYEMADDIFGLLNNISNKNYTDAFNGEHEIWFNCKEYYLLPAIDYNYMMREING